MSDSLYRFIDSMRTHGLGMHSGELEADGQLHRYRVDGDRSGTLNGWYIAHPGEPMFGTFGSWRTGQTHNFASKKLEEMSDADRRALAERRSISQSLRDKYRNDQHASAAKRAEAIWQMSGSVEVHEYLRTKGVRPYGIRQFNDRLVVPMRDASGVLWSLQFIFPDGRKRFLTGGKKRGNYFAIGLPTHTVCVCEGFATGGSIYASTGLATAIAFDAGNLQPVAEALRRKFPKLKIVIAADNDVHTPGNPGVTAAVKAAAAVGGLVALPTFEAAN